MFVYYLSVKLDNSGTLKSQQFSPREALAIDSNQENKIFTYNLFSMKHIQMLVEYEIAAQRAKKCTK